MDAMIVAVGTGAAVVFAAGGAGGWGESMELS
jgi:hypothetical protein